MPIAKHKSVKQALEYVAAHPEYPDIAPLDMPIWELVSRNLFEIANNPDARVQGSMARATRAQKIILNRMTGTRRAGTKPAVRDEIKIIFNDLTTQGLEAPRESVAG